MSSLNWPFSSPSEDEFGPPRVPSGYRSQTPPSRQRDEYDDDRYSTPVDDNRYASSRTQQRGQYGNDEYELRQSNGASNTAAGDIHTMPGYLAEVCRFELNAFGWKRCIYLVQFAISRLMPSISLSALWTKTFQPSMIFIARLWWMRLKPVEHLQNLTPWSTRPTKWTWTSRIELRVGFFWAI